MSESTLKLSESTEMRFFIDNYQGTKRGHIRKHVNTDNYSGPTKSGIRMSKEELSEVLGILGKLNTDESVSGEKFLGEYKIDDTRSIKVQIQKFRDTYGIDIRQYANTEKYTGPTKRGIRIPLKYLGEAKGYIKSLLEELNKSSE